MEKFDVAQRWPELFAQLDESQRTVVIETLASSWHEGWEPNREDVENLTDHARGAIDTDEYLRRADAAVERHRGIERCPGTRARYACPLYASPPHRHGDRRTYRVHADELRASHIGRAQ